MKVVLINPVELVHPPLGLMYVASALERAGAEVSIEEVPSRHIVDFDDSVAGLINNLQGDAPQMIGITCMAAQRYEVRRIIDAIRKEGIPAKVVVGGVHASFMPEEVMSWDADYAVINEGEDTVVELAGVIDGKRRAAEVRGLFYREAGEIRKAPSREPIEDLDRLPLPAYHLMDRRRFTTRKGLIRGRWLKGGWIMTSRGCPSLCIFCSAHRMFGRKVRYRGLDSIFEELGLLVREFGIEAFVIVDDTFTINKERVARFCGRLKKEFPRLQWSCQARVDFFDEEFARMLKDAGCIQVDFGVESGSQRVLNRLKKRIEVENTVCAFDACRKTGLRTLATIMVGNPDEDEKDLEKTRLLLRRIRPDFSAAYYTTPFPGTELYEEARKKGLIGDPERYWQQYTKPVPMSRVENGLLEKALRDFTSLNVARNYLLNPLFLLDMARFCVLNPALAARITLNLLRGHVEKALFMVTNSLYFKRQGEVWR